MTIVVTATLLLLKNHAVTKKSTVALQKIIKPHAVTKVSPKIRLMPAVPPHRKMLQNSRSAVINVVAVSNLLHPKHHAVTKAAVATKIKLMPLQTRNLAARKAMMDAAQKKWTKHLLPTKNAALHLIAFVSR